MKIRLLRGQVVIREERNARWAQYSHVLLPARDRDQDDRERESHVGTVLAMGPRAKTRGGSEVAPGFVVGDRVCFHWEHHEARHTRPWVDGEDACWVPQQAIDAVLE